MTVEEILEKCEQDDEWWTVVRSYCILNYDPWPQARWDFFRERWIKLSGLEFLPEGMSTGWGWKPAKEPFSKLFRINAEKPEEES